MSDAEVMAMAGTADAALQVMGNIVASNFTYKHTKELARYQNDMAIENWNMANAYNSPSAQMERFKAAGLNPNLMYGQGNPGNATTVGAPSLPNMNYKNPFAGVQLAGMFQQVKNAALQGKAQELHNDQAYMDLWAKANTVNAWQQFAYDHRAKGEDLEKPVVFIPTSKGMKQEQTDEYASYIRGTSQYKQLELLWQKGELNESNIGLIDTKKNVLGFSEEKNTLLRDVLQGDVDMKKLVTLLLLNLLESSTSAGVLGKIF